MEWISQVRLEQRGRIRQLDLAYSDPTVPNHVVNKLHDDVKWYDKYIKHLVENDEVIVRPQTKGAQTLDCEHVRDFRTNGTEYYVVCLKCGDFL